MTFAVRDWGEIINISFCLSGFWPGPVGHWMMMLLKLQPHTESVGGVRSLTYINHCLHLFSCFFLYILALFTDYQIYIYNIYILLKHIMCQASSHCV